MRRFKAGVAVAVVFAAAFVGACGDQSAGVTAAPPPTTAAAAEPGGVPFQQPAAKCTPRDRLDRLVDFFAGLGAGDTSRMGVAFYRSEASWGLRLPRGTTWPEGL